MRISIEAKNLKVDELIKILNIIDAETSFLLTDYNNREYSFGELKIKEKS